MTKTIEASYPQTIKDCTPDQLTKWLMLAPVIQNTNKSLSNMLDFQSQMVSIFTGLPINKVRKIHIDDIMHASTTLLKMLAEHKTSEPAEFITIEGQRYRFERDFAHIETGQIIDMKLIDDVSQSPCEALAICYIEEGMEYCQEDNRGKVLNPNKKREEIFKRSFPGDEFLNYFAFFFARIREAESRNLGNTDSEADESESDNAQETLRDSEWFNWTRILINLAQQLNKDVDEITRQPYVKTLFWMNYFKLKAEQDYILQRHG